MLVKLFALDDGRAHAARMAASGIGIRRALAAERGPVVTWAAARFGAGWAGECETGFSTTPTRCLLALGPHGIAGFALWDVTALGFFGPTGVDAEARGLGIGAALLHGVLTAMRGQGYGYAIIGNAGAPGFFARVAGATEIAGSSPGIYAGMIRAGTTGPAMTSPAMTGPD